MVSRKLVKMNFRVVLLNDSIHTQCFAELADSVVWALRELGHEVERASTIDVSEKGAPTNIVFGLRPGTIAASIAERLQPGNNIVLYNGEQATTASIFPGLMEAYKRHTVWDYSHENARRYASFGLKMPQVVRPGYCPLLEGRVPQVEKDHDVVFFGSKNERRQQLLDDLRAAGMSVLEVPFGIYGAERDAYLARARIAVNVHYYEDSIFEAVRCSHLMHSGIPVVTEKSAGLEASDWLPLRPQSYRDLVAACRSALAGDLAYDAVAQLERLKGISLLDDVREAIVELESVVVEAGTTAGRDGKQVDKRHKITLSMIVKNEADVIERCLRSVAPHLTGYCIVDTGSADGTQDIIRRTMEELSVPGVVHDRPWREFDGSRSEAIDLAREQCAGEGWIMLIDADEVLYAEGSLEINESLFGHYGWVTRCLVGCVQWARPLLLRANKPWFYEMPRHEGLYCREFAPLSDMPLDNVKVLSSHDGARAKESARVRFARDAHVLEKWLLDHPGHTRAAYYIAQSYKDAGGADPWDKALLQKAIMWYQRRAQMPGGFDQETFSAMYQAALWMSACDYPWERVQNQLLQAYAFRPSRAEPLQHLAYHYRTNGKYALGAIFARAAAEIPMPSDAFHDVDRDVYAYKAKDEWGVCLTYLKQHAKALELFKECIEVAPEHERQRIQDNIDMCARALGIVS